MPARPRLVTLLAALLAVALLPAAALAAPAPAPGPVHAGNTYGWYHGHNVERWEFYGAMSHRIWKVRGPGVVRTQHGMLTLNTARRGTVSATLQHRGHATGRWEIRLRSRHYESGHTAYRVTTSLVPAGSRPQHCGGRDIGLEDYVPGRYAAHFFIHTLPHNAFVASRRVGLRTDQWHTFAVEVTRHHIAWFVDAHVVRNEHRPAALSGVPLTVRFAMQAVPGHRMDRSRMQMDWLRYWPADRPSSRSVAAPSPRRTTYAAAC
ncbi:MAG: hypothetical protein ACTHJH_12030 [Marmoricola sp.]